MDASIPEHNNGGRFSSSRKKKAPHRMSSFSSDGGNSFQGILDEDDTEIEIDRTSSYSHRSNNLENTPTGTARFGMADVHLDASAVVDHHRMG